jgi:protein gp37
MASTKIEWAEATWNPIRGCTRVSEGCRNCYAERMAARHLPGMDSPLDGEAYARMTESGPRWTGKVELIEDKIMEPLSWRKPRRIFVNSMSDLFHELVLEEWLYYVLAMVAATPRHTFIVLTKRAWLMRQRMGRSCATAWRECILRTQESLGIAAQVVDWPLPNLWLGVSVENQRAADERIPDLLATPAALRFVSCEPLLGPVDLYTWLPLLEIERESRGPDDRYVDWVIVGGESGPGARPMHPSWARLLRNQCRRAHIPFFFKQWGEWLPQGQFGVDGDTPTVANTGSRWGVLDGAGNYFGETTAWNGRTGDASESGEVYVYRVGKRDAGRLLDGRTWDEVPLAGGDHAAA